MPASVIVLQLAERSKKYISDTHLPLEVETNGVENGEMTESISDVSEACIRDLVAPSRKK